MKSIIINTSISVSIALFLVFIQFALKSDYLILYLKDNIITILIALLAINSATMSIILSKLRELMDKFPSSTFENTKREMILSVKEQIFLILIAATLLIIKYSKVYINSHISDIFVDTLLIATFIYALRILYDTATSVFVLLEYKSQ